MTVTITVTATFRCDGCRVEKAVSNKYQEHLGRDGESVHIKFEVPSDWKPGPRDGFLTTWERVLGHDLCADCQEKTRAAINALGGQPPAAIP